MCFNDKKPVAFTKYKYKNTSNDNDSKLELVRSSCMLSNSYSACHVISHNNYKFDKLFTRRAFVHWFVGEGMSEGEIQEAREENAIFERDMEEAFSTTTQDKKSMAVCNSLPIK